MKKVKIKPNYSALYEFYGQFKALLDYYIEHEEQNIVSRKELIARLEYIRKNKCNQRNEIETILWILGGEPDDIN